MSMKRIEYAGSVHDEEEIEAVVSVLRGGPTALRILCCITGQRATAQDSSRLGGTSATTSSPAHAIDAIYLNQINQYVEYVAPVMAQTLL